MLRPPRVFRRRRLAKRSERASQPMREKQVPSPRRRKLRIVRSRASVRAHSLRRSSSPQKTALGSPVRLQAPSRRFAVATTLLRFLYLQAPYRSLPRKRASSLAPLHTELFTLPPFPFSFVFSRGMNGVQRLRRNVYLIAELSHSAPIAARRAVQLAGFASLAYRKRPRSARLFGCKRPHDGSLSLPLFCGYGIRCANQVLSTAPFVPPQGSSPAFLLHRF